MSPSAADVVVVGAGTMGAWTALRSRRAGWSTTLIDAFGAGHPRATSGDETRILRSAHGADTFYARWSREARSAWRAFEDETGERFFIEAGMLWFARREDGFEAHSMAALTSIDIPVRRLSTADSGRRVAADRGRRPGIRRVRARSRVAAGTERGGRRGPDVRRGRRAIRARLGDPRHHRGPSPHRRRHGRWHTSRRRHVRVRGRAVAAPPLPGRRGRAHPGHEAGRRCSSARRRATAGSMPNGSPAGSTTTRRCTACRRSPDGA